MLKAAHLQAALTWGTQFAPLQSGFLLPCLGSEVEELNSTFIANFSLGPALVLDIWTMGTSQVPSRLSRESDKVQK